MARTALRLHPRAGTPTVEESSVGGPLLWPTEEPWPVCERPHPHARHETPGPGIPRNAFMRLLDSVSPSTVRVYRRLLQEGWDRGRDAEGRIFTPEDEALMNAAADADLERRFESPSPMLPIVQLYLRDAHGIVTGPDGADLLQILWCPFNHDPDYMPTSRIHWRRSADVVDCLLIQPEPSLIEKKDYFPDPCVVHPEPVTEYPAPHMLPDELRDRIHQREEVWVKNGGIQCYQFDLGVAPGWKIGGWGPWSFRDPSPMTCPECGTEQQPFLYVDSDEWDGGSASWIPREDLLPDAWPHQHPSAGNQVQVNIGRGYGMQIYTCPDSYDHPSVECMQ